MRAQPRRAQIMQYARFSARARVRAYSGSCRQKRDNVSVAAAATCGCIGMQPRLVFTANAVRKTTARLKDAFAQ